MIRRFHQIKYFGVFADFQWPSNLPEFKKFNLIYGWNYSGKTTLSRVFRCFELQKPHADFEIAEVQLKSADGTTHHLALPNTAPLFRVFNSDFVSDNLYFGEGSTTPILVVGAGAPFKQESLKAKKIELATLTTNRKSNELARDEKRVAINKALSNSARDLIKIPLGIPDYERPNFESKVHECKTNPESYLLDDQTLTQCLLVFQSTDKKPFLDTKVVSLSSISTLRENVAELLTRIVSANQPISRLKENPVLEKWVKQGRPLHEGKNTCQFCERPLPSAWLAHLTNHFSDDYENLMEELSDLAQKIHTAEEEEIALDHKADFYPELSADFSSKKEQLSLLLNKRKAALSSLTSALVEKQTKAFTKLECPIVTDPGDDIASTVEAINQIIETHNTRTKSFDLNRQEAFKKIEKHYAASFVRDQKYIEQLQQIADISATVVDQKTKIEQLDNDIRDLEQELSEASKGAECINALLAAYFGTDDLRIEVSSEKRFQIKRGGVIAKNLSEGEKTAIAFAHFIARVQDKKFSLEDTIVVINDPISSLDANHLFNTYALIKTQLANCKQLFISTHSFEFYNLIREWVTDDENIKKSQAEWKDWGVYLVKRTDVGTAVLEEIPKELLRFRSEYHYLFSMLYQFDKDGAGDFASLLSLPNVVRRFLEAFGGIMIPLNTGLKGKMERLFSDQVERERVWKFINHYSHNTTITRSLTIPDTSECKAVVKTCLKAVEGWDPDYLADLVREVSI